MKTRILSVLALLAFAAGPVAAVEIDFASPAFEIGKTSSGADLTTGFTFSLGSFGSFTPTAGNTSQWSVNFNSLGSTSWDDVFTDFSGVVSLSSNTSPFTTNNQAFIWGYNTTTGASGEWVLITNANWTFPAVVTGGGTQLPTQWSTTDTGTYAIVGLISSSLGANPYLQTAAVSNTNVPEPATFAALFGTIALGAVLVRRRMCRAV